MLTTHQKKKRKAASVFIGVEEKNVPKHWYIDSVKFDYKYTHKNWKKKSPLTLDKRN